MKPEILVSVHKGRVPERKGLEIHSIWHILKIKRNKNITPADVLISTNTSANVHLCSILMNHKKNTDFLEGCKAPVEQIQHRQCRGFKTICFSSPLTLPIKSLTSRKGVGFTSNSHSRTLMLSQPAV